MSTTHQVRTWWADDRCDPGELIDLFGHTVRLRAEAHDAGRALEAALIATGYGPVDVLGSHRWCPTGIGGRTCQPSGYSCSLHNYSLALDFDPFAAGNPYFQRRFRDSDWSRTKFTPAQVAAGEGVRTNNGKQAWKWLGWAIGDTMHWEITCSPADLATGIDPDTVPNYNGGDGMALRRGMGGNAVRRLQSALINWNEDALPEWGADGDYGAETEEWVTKYQAAADLPETGVSDGVTTAFILEWIKDHAASSGGTVDTAARAAAAGAKARAETAHTRLDKLHEV